MKGKCKLIIDTNLWISFLLTGKYDFLLDLLEKECIVIVFCDALLDEFIRVSQRSKLKKMFSKNDWDTISDLIVKHAIFCKLESDIGLYK